MDELRAVLRRALVVRFGVGSAAFDDMTELFSSGLIDSLSVIDLVNFVESEIGCPIPPAEITLDHFDSVDRIVRFASTLRAGRDS